MVRAALAGERSCSFSSPLTSLQTEAVELFTLQDGRGAAVSDSVMVRPLQAILLCSPFSCLLSASLSLVFPAEIENCSEQRDAACIVSSGSFGGLLSSASLGAC